ncbi:type II toxin-antitoxin system PemK/MazF family toxin [Nocardia arizonensis]|uniref:type II toxin-antitoxin system PemK/MazF family toxin n=1 Tax=Nocardia arizonensis TaxID=1141647 RepID=UPI000B022098|nr:type II toxin-antitoxin system PemK/MazF family toxin [Nocardia arizonensis]
MIRAAVHRIDLGRNDRGREQQGKRYGVILSEVDWSMVTVVPTSTSAQPSRFRPQIELLSQPTLLLVDQIRSLDSRYVGEMVGYLPREDMKRLEHAITRYLGL